MPVRPGLLFAILASVLVVGGPIAAWASSLDSQVASARGSSLPLRSELEQSAASSAARQARQGSISHSNIGALTDICSAVGEIVGAGTTVEAIFSAFRQSPYHLAKLTDPSWTAMGTGQATDSSGIVYVSVIFCTENGKSVQKPPSPTGGSSSRPTGGTASAVIEPPVLQLSLVAGWEWDSDLYPI